MKLRSASKKEEKKPVPASEKKTNKSSAISKKKGADQANAAKKAASSKQTITTHPIIGKSAIEAPHARFHFPSDIDEEFGFGESCRSAKTAPQAACPEWGEKFYAGYLEAFATQKTPISTMSNPIYKISTAKKIVHRIFSFRSISANWGAPPPLQLKNDFEPTPNPERVDPFLLEFRPQMPIWCRPCNYIMLDPWESPRKEFREIDDLLCRQFKPVWVDNGHVDYVEVTNKAYGWNEAECPEWYDVSYPLIFKGRHFSRADGYWSGTDPPQLPPGWSWGRTRGHYHRDGRTERGFEHPQVPDPYKGSWVGKGRGAGSHPSFQDHYVRRKRKFE